MRAAIYSPYLDTLGGGEKYMMNIAQVLSEKGFGVDVILDNHLNNIGADYLKKALSERFNLNLSNVSFAKGPIGKGSDILSRIFFLKQYDVFFYLTDGSIFYPTARKNILHIQSPLVGQPAKSLWGKFKLKGWNKIIYNSKFTKDNSEKNWPIVSEIIYPPVDVDKIKPLKKKKYILSVGRFFGYLKDKKHEILIKTFKELFLSGNKDWSLHLVGSAGEGDREYLECLQRVAKDLPVKFYPNMQYMDLLKLYGESSVYWHASGFGEEDPTKMEHFGISTVEAMAGGAVPVVIGKGGQTEIVENGKSGFLWETLEEMKVLTLRLMKDDLLWSKLSAGSIERSKLFNRENFKQKILELI